MRLTKTELRDQQVRLAQLQRYLPTLQLKKALLQMEVNLAAAEIDQLAIHFKTEEERIAAFSSLFTDPAAFDLMNAVKVSRLIKAKENIAGIEIPLFEGIEFVEDSYSLFDTPAWMETAVAGVRAFVTLGEKLKIVREKKRLLERELREVSTRVNLFEKILIPRALDNIKKIKIFLGDQQLAAIAQAKMAKKLLA